ncbi:GSU3473 family protein [Geotalea uraniireducens]|uniref:GSU3473 family protein n=1 Tax=Geotalea uraniireducens TaxID=351604 RepID=UPI000305D9FF|nr:hypothetical protein [Geotalea uraniireducens]
MGVLVLYNNNVYDVVSEERLDSLIAEKKIVGYHRSTEWVTVGHDPLRVDGGAFTDGERGTNAESE